MLQAFHSPVIEVADFDSAVGNYARLLGQEPFWIESNEARHTRSALFPLDNTTLEIRARAAGAGAGQGAREGLDPPGGAPEAMLDRGLVVIRLAADGGEALLEELAARGVSIEAPVLESATRLENGRAGSQRSWTSVRVDPVSSRGIAIELVADEEGEQPVVPEHRGEVRAAVSALDHVVIFSAEIETTRDFYRDALGIRLALDRSFEQRGVRLIFFRIGGTTIEIGGRLGSEVRPDARDRFGGLAWQVPDIDRIRDRLIAERFDVSEIRDGNKPGTRVCTVRDPVHGVPTLLIEPVA